MPNFTGKYLEDFVDYLDNETQTDDLSDSENEIEPFAIQREARSKKTSGRLFHHIISYGPYDMVIISKTLKMSCYHSLCHQVEFNLNLTSISIKVFFKFLRNHF